MPKVELPDGTVANFPDGTPTEVMTSAIQQHLMAVGAERSVAGAEAGAQARSDAPSTEPSAADFRRNDEIPSANPPPGAPGGPPARPMAMAVPLQAMAWPLAAEGLAASGAAFPGLLGTAGRLYAANPKAGNAVLGAIPGALHGSWKEAAVGASIGAGLNIGNPGTSPALTARLAHTITREAPELLQAGRASSSLPRMAATLPRTAQGTTAAARALEGAGLSPELATAESAKMAATAGEVSGSLPGVYTPPGGTPALKMPAVAWAEDIQSQVATLRAAGMSKAVITETVRETHRLEAGTAGKLVDSIFETTGKVAPVTTQVLPAGRKTMGTNMGGKAQPYLGPARVPQGDEDLMGLLQATYDKYKMP